MITTPTRAEALKLNKAMAWGSRLVSEGVAARSAYLQWQQSGDIGDRHAYRHALRKLLVVLRYPTTASEA